MDSSSNLETRYKAAQQGRGSHELDSFFDDDKKPAVRTRHVAPKMSMNMWQKYKKWLIALAALIVVAVGVKLVLGLVQPSVPGVNPNSYQAVFLVDGTQYVGKLVNLDGGHYKLTNAYFITSAQAPVVSEKGAQPTTGNQVSLVKLETGLLTAENEMTIPKDKVLFYENLKADGQAAKLLDAEKQKK